MARVIVCVYKWGPAYHAIRHIRKANPLNMTLTTNSSANVTYTNTGEAPTTGAGRIDPATMEFVWYEEKPIPIGQGWMKLFGLTVPLSGVEPEPTV